MNKKAIMLMTVSLLTLGGTLNASHAKAAMFTDVTASKIDEASDGLDKNKDKLKDIKSDVKVKHIDLNYFSNLKKQNEDKKRALNEEKAKEEKSVNELKLEISALKEKKAKEAKKAEEAAKVAKEKEEAALKEKSRESSIETVSASPVKETATVSTKVATDDSGLDLNQRTGTVDTAALANYMVAHTRNASGYSASEWKYILDHESKGRLDVYNFGGSGAYGVFQLLGHGEYQGMTLKEQIDMAQNLPAGSWVVYN